MVQANDPLATINSLELMQNRTVRFKQRDTFINRRDPEKVVLMILWQAAHCPRS
jgi:hypothetical protein